MSKKRRIKATAIPVPKTREEAEKLLGEIGLLQGNVSEIERRAAERVSSIQRAYSELAMPVNDQIQGKFEALHAYAEAHRHELLEGDSKSVKLATGTLSWRWTPPAIKLTKVEEVIARLQFRKLRQYLRTTVEVNKEALLEAGEEAVKALEIPGIKFTSREEFVAKPLESQIERVETVTATKTRRAA